MSKRYYFAGGRRMPGTGLPANVTGDCPHRHRTPEAAERCIDDMDRAIKRGHGPNAYCDRIVMVQLHPSDPLWEVASSSAIPLGELIELERTYHKEAS